LVAVVSDRELPVTVPRFDLEAVGPLADFIEREFLPAVTPSRVDALVDGRWIPLEKDIQEILARVVRSLVGDPRDLSGGPPIELRIHGSTP
ncbi:MAG TPA: hypothetical protein VLG48_10725, partial [Candidatus Methylomirabilis sp.]|nr:hypothetical protein [Candidatus Methylomirabilis sp.]